MKYCPFCAGQVQDTALVCRHCGGDLTKPDLLGSPEPDRRREPEPQGVAPSRSARSKKRTGGLLVLVVILALGIIYRVSQGAGSGGPLALFMVPRTVVIAERQDFDVPPGKLQTWQWVATPRQPRCHVTGRFDVLNGAGTPVRVYVLSQGDFANFINGRVASAYFESPPETATTLDVTTTAPGPMVLAVLNAASVDTGTRVRATAVKAVCQ